jgi:hypothetical protein
VFEKPSKQNVLCFQHSSHTYTINTITTDVDAKVHATPNQLESYVSEKFETTAAELKWSDDANHAIDMTENTLENVQFYAFRRTPPDTFPSEISKARFEANPYCLLYVYTSSKNSRQIHKWYLPSMTAAHTLAEELTFTAQEKSYMPKPRPKSVPKQPDPDPEKLIQNKQDLKNAIENFRTSF